jgi:hypothetical protein
MQTTERSTHHLGDAQQPFWFGQMPAGWGDVLHTVDPNEAHTAEAMIDAARSRTAVCNSPSESGVADEVLEDLRDVRRAAAASDTTYHFVPRGWRP